MKHDQGWPALELVTFTSAAMYALHQGGLAGWIACGAFTLLTLLTLMVTH
jgi:hypothetical protein